MRKVVPLLLFITLSVGVFAFEVGAYFDLSNLDFPSTRTAGETALPGADYLWGIRVTGHDQLSEGLALDLSYCRDSVLRHIAFTRIAYTDDFFSITVGPFFGLLNSPNTIVQSGLSTTVELYIPGVTFLRLRSDNSLSGRLVVTGDYIQEQSELAIGFYTPNVIPTVYVASKRYTTKTDSGEAVDSLTEYGITTDIFQKNVPYQIALNFAYQDAGRQFVDATTVNHAYGSVVIGARVTLSLFDAFTLVADLDSSIYTFGRDFLLGEVSSDSFLFRLSTGLEINLDAFAGN
ncbi:MAG: hypothetical protein KAU31_06465 [Spirochaetaceae bacterium]|nr:hypothetical protein [Spirochaetaceae bacterium]